VINPNEYGSLLYDEKEMTYTQNVIKTRRVFRYSKTQFDYVTQFELEMTKLLKTTYCLGVINGTAGLIVALNAIGIKPGEKVLISSYTFQATALAVIAVGAIPIPVEINLDTGIDLEDLEENYTYDCKAIIVTQLQGRCFNLSKLKQFAELKKIVLIEDACQAFGSKYRGVYSGCQGDIGVFSFQQFKQISAGEGGAVVTNNESYYKCARNYSDMGAVRNRFPDWNADDTIMGQNYRMNQLCGAILCAQLEKLNYMISCQQGSRKRIYMRFIDQSGFILHSKDPEGDTGMNILLGIKQNHFYDAVQLSNQYNVEVRKMWSNLYFENLLFKKAHLTDIDLRLTRCQKSQLLADELAVISIPPVLHYEHEETIADVISKLENKNYLISIIG